MPIKPTKVKVVEKSFLSPVDTDLVTHGREVVLATKALAKVPASIDSMSQYKVATDAATALTLRVKNATTAMKYYVDPKMQEVKEIKSKFAAIIDPAAELLTQVKDRMKVFLIAEQARKDKEQLAIEAKAIAGATEGEESVNVPVVNNIKTQSGNLGTSTGRTIKKWRVVNEALIPRQYLVVNEAEITKAMRMDIVVPGVEFYSDISMTIRAKG